MTESGIVGCSCEMTVLPNNVGDFDMATSLPALNTHTGWSAVLLMLSPRGPYSKVTALPEAIRAGFAP